jgi:short-subunit dehydrogenase
MPEDDRTAMDAAAKDTAVVSSTPSLSPRHVAITGASSGIGRALAELYAAPGRVLSLAGRNPERLAAVALVCRAKGAEVDTVIAEVTDAKAVEAWLERRDDTVPIDLLVANAGMGGAAVMSGPTGEGGDVARQIFMINTLGVVNAVSPLLPRMIERRRGHLVLMGSLAGAIGLPHSPAYSASKAAVRVYGDGIRRLARHHGVRVTNVLPGFVDTPMSQSLAMGRPFLWTAERAAQKIARDVARGAGQSIFPWPLRVSTVLQGFVPVPIADFVLSLAYRWRR